MPKVAGHYGLRPIGEIKWSFSAIILAGGPAQFSGQRGTTGGEVRVTIRVKSISRKLVDRLVERRT